MVNFEFIIWLSQGDPRGYAISLIHTVLPIGPSIAPSISVCLRNCRPTDGASTAEPAAALLLWWLLLSRWHIDGLCVWLLILLRNLVRMRVILRLLVWRALWLSVIVRVLVETILRSSDNTMSSSTNRLTCTLEGLERKTAASLLVGVI